MIYFNPKCILIASAIFSAIAGAFISVSQATDEMLVERSVAWSSILYGDAWDSEALGEFDSDKLIQDFSYAGYYSGERELPFLERPLYDVTKPPFNADSTGNVDTTRSIQSAIDQATDAGGGVVYLPKGQYLVSVDTDEKEALRVSGNNVVLRGDGVGETLIHNVTSNMRGRAIIRFQAVGGISPYYRRSSIRATIVENVLRPSRRLFVEDSSQFEVGDLVLISHDMTDEWIDEHGELSWKNPGGSRPKAPTYIREIRSILEDGECLELDVPIRYSLKCRDKATVYKILKPPLIGSGIESISISNREASGQSWREGDFKKPGTGGYEVHGACLISFERVRDCWARDVSSYLPASNQSGAHFVSNGIRIIASSHVTLMDVDLRAAQYGGAGGNGYHYNLVNASECLLVRCRAEVSRHGFVFSNAGTSGNVLYRCYDKDSGQAVGAGGGYRTGGSGSDHHMKFSHSNLVDSCVSYNSFWDARYRPHPKGSKVLHGVTAAHSVYWNAVGMGDLDFPLIRTEQARYGYVIGTSGDRFDVVSTRFGGEMNDPVDHVVGVGAGESLYPQSLYLDQLDRRLKRSNP